MNGQDVELARANLVYCGLKPTQVGPVGGRDPVDAASLSQRYGSPGPERLHNCATDVVGSVCRAQKLEACEYVSDELVTRFVAGDRLGRSVEVDPSLLHVRDVAFTVTVLA